MNPKEPARAGKIRTLRLVQPPLTQLNGPYPAIYYLRSFLARGGYQVTVQDHSIGFAERIFCWHGLGIIFAQARQGYANIRDKALARIAARFFSEEERWLNTIEPLMAFLQGRNREWGHFLALGNGVLPGGPRFDAALASMDRIGPDAAPLLASKLLADLADFITAAADPAFSLIRYGPVIPQDKGGFPGPGSFTGPLLERFYGPLLEDEWQALERDLAPGEPFALGLSIPFPGCLRGALFCAASAKKRFGEQVTVLAGGGYVNTDLRFLETPEFFHAVDYLCFDRGYGSLTAILERGGDAGEPGLYKTLYRSRCSGRIIPRLERYEVYERIDDEAATVFPDYSGVDFSRYLYPVDDANPMHRLWSEGRWLKAYLAHGCYWRGCAFCDTELDYIRRFIPLDPAALFRHLQGQAEKTGLRGVHLVDEAAPAASLLALAELNREAGLPLLFWGNIRFDRDFTPDAAALLAAGGLLGVSGGIEVATESGFKRLNKGVGLREVVRACAALKEQGILTHGYLMYGCWDQDVQEIIDAAETVRQLFAEGLLDSAFWHQFILTRHSRLYAEWRRGLHPGLQVREPGNAQGPRFALNDLRFEGEEGFFRFAEPLDRLLAAWMSGDLGPDTLDRAFSFKVPRPSVSPATVTALLDRYARNRDQERQQPPGAAEPGNSGKPPLAERVLFLGSKPMPQSSAGGSSLIWRWRTEEHRLNIQNSRAAEQAGALLERVSRSPGLEAETFYQELEGLLGTLGAKQAWKVLRNRGLAMAAKRPIQP